MDVSGISMTAWAEPDEDGESECVVSGTEPPLPAVAGAEAIIVSELRTMRVPQRGTREYHKGVPERGKPGTLDTRNTLA